MSKLQVTSSKLREAKGTLDRQNQLLNDQISKLRQTESKLNSMWEGEAKQAFQQVFNKDMTQFEAFHSLIGKYGNVLEQAAQNYEDKERKNIELASHRG